MKKRKWLRLILAGGLLLLAASFGFSRALRSSAARRYLIAQLSANFGRPVDVSWFDFSLLNGARVQAHFVSVSEDPHFGGEYFLRADSLTAGLRWTSLLTGRFEFGSVSLSRPSLNLTRDAEGRWNIERWLPPPSPAAARPGFVGPLAPGGDVRPARPYRFDVDGGRINFKQGDSKSPFALADVSGIVEQNGAGRWQLDLEARPMRAGVGLQDIGTLRLRGSIAGTTARLQPADLNLTWRAASIADALRLVRQNDYGMRGQLAVDLTARIAPQATSTVAESVPASVSGNAPEQVPGKVPGKTQGAIPAALPAVDSGGAQWSISGVARLTGIHGWRLPGHATDPAANLAFDLNWRLGERRAEIRNAVVELPASHLQGRGELDWSSGIQPQLQIASSTLALGDVLSWYRALRPDVAEDLRADCSLGVNLKLGGWPLQFQQGAISSSGGAVTSKLFPAPLQVGELRVAVARGGFDVAPAVLSFGARASSPNLGTRSAANASVASVASANSFVLRASLFPRANGEFRWPPDWNFSIEGMTPRVEDWLAVSAAFAQPLNTDWTATGGLAARMHRSRVAVSPDVPWLGSMDFLDLTLSPAYVNQPVRVPRAHVDFAPVQRTITVAPAEAFGAVWRGSISRKYTDDHWTFDLSADQLDAAELDRWLGPRARPGFLARFAGLNTAAVASPAPDAVVTRLAARGHLHAGMIDIPPMQLEQFDGDAEIAGRTVRIRTAKADFFGGKISGSLNAQLLSDPSYEFQGRLDRVDLAQLAAAVPFLDGRMDGAASGTLSLSAHGIGRQNLVRTLQGDGEFSGKNVGLRGFDLSSAFPGPAAESDSGVFPSVQGVFRVQSGGIDLQDVVMDNARGRLQAEGRIDFSHTLNIRVRPSIFQAATAGASVSPPSFLLGGTIEAPKLAIPNANPKPPARATNRR